MPKLEVNKVAEILKKDPTIQPASLRRIIEELNLAAQPDGAAGDKVPPVKKQFAVLVSDPDGKMPRYDFVAWVLQIPEDESVATVEERIKRGAYDFNASRKGRLHPVGTIGEAIENVPQRYFTEAEVWIKSKTPVLVLKTDNVLPKDDGPSRDERPEHADADDQDVEVEATDATSEAAEQDAT